MAQRKIDDAGEIVLGARKHYYGKGLTKGDIEGLTAEEATKLVTKDNVWPAPDYAAMTADGLDPKVIALKKIIRDRIAATPDLQAAGYREKSGVDIRNDYIEVLNAIQKTVEGVRIRSDFEGVESKVRELLGFANAHWRDDTPSYKIGLATSRGKNYFPHHIRHRDEVKAGKMVADGFPEVASKPLWQRKLVIIQHAQTGEWRAVRKGLVIAKGFSSEEEGLEIAQKIWDDEQTKKTGGPKEPPPRAALSALERYGLPDWREGRDIGPEKFIEHFGFRGVQFGESIPDKERQMILNHAYDALNDLAHIFETDAKAISFNGFMAAAFGARGQGWAAAHFEPGKRIFNLGRINGAGSLCHEWAHGFDNAVAEFGQAYESRGNARWASELKRHYNLSDEQSASWVQLMTTLISRPVTKVERLAKLQADVDAKKAKIAPYVEILEAGTLSERDVPQYRKYVDHYAKQIVNAEAGIEREAQLPEDHYFGEAPTDYVNEAIKLCGVSGKYWKQQIELYARAFECAVYDRLLEMGARSDFLVHSVDGDLYADPVLFKGNPYPRGEERQVIGKAVFEMMQMNKVHFEQSMGMETEAEMDFAPSSGL